MKNGDKNKSVVLIILVSVYNMCIHVCIYIYIYILIYFRFITCKVKHFF